MSAITTLPQEITVGWNFPVTFTRDLFAPENAVLADALNRLGENRRHRAMVFLDDSLAAALPGLAEKIRAWFSAHAAGAELVGDIVRVPGGEAAKNDLRLVDEFMTLLLQRRMDRQSYTVIIGGGAVLDAVGLAAALVHRGLRQIRVPTTVLAQNDAGVGLKNAINFRGGKNAIGTFAPPFAVLNDFAFLSTLPPRDWLCGVAEAFKVAMIKDAAFFDWLCEAAPRFAARDMAAMEQLVIRCADLHLHHIRSNGDPFEYGRARPLDFGHWSAHKLELLSAFRVSHGEAVACGILLDAIYAVAQGWLAAADMERLRDGLKSSGFPLWHREYELADPDEPDGGRAIFAGLRDFQEHLGGELTVTFPLGLGSRHEVHEINLASMEAAVQTLRSFI